jgi:hypothetical protein
MLLLFNFLLIDPELFTQFPEVPDIQFRAVSGKRAAIRFFSDNTKGYGQAQADRKRAENFLMLSKKNQRNVAV